MKPSYKWRKEVKEGTSSLKKIIPLHEGKGIKGMESPYKK